MSYDFSRIQVNLRDATPIFDQIARQMRLDIHSGVIGPGTRLPTVRQIAQHLRVNFNTVARAYRILDEEGLILSRQGQGSFVAEDVRASIASGESDASGIESQGAQPVDMAPEEAIPTERPPVELAADLTVQPDEPGQKPAFAASEQMTRLFEEIESLTHAAGFEFADLVAYQQSMENKPSIRRRKKKKTAFIRIAREANVLILFAQAIRKKMSMGGRRRRS